MDSLFDLKRAFCLIKIGAVFGCSSGYKRIKQYWRALFGASRKKARAVWQKPPSTEGRARGIWFFALA